MESSESFLQKLKKSWILHSIVIILAGTVLVMFPSITLNAISYVLGSLAIIMGLVRTIRYFQQGQTDPFLFQSDLVVGLLSIGLGLYLVSTPNRVISMVPFVFGILLVGCGVGNILQALNAKKAGLSSWSVLLALAILAVIAGLFCLINPFSVMETTVIVIGAALIYLGVTDMISTIIARKKIAILKNS